MTDAELKIWRELGDLGDELKRRGVVQKPVLEPSDCSLALAVAHLRRVIQPASPIEYWWAHEHFTRAHGAMQSALCSLLIALDRSLKSADPDVQPADFKLDVRSAYDRLLRVLGP